MGEDERAAVPLNTMSIRPVEFHHASGIAATIAVGNLRRTPTVGLLQAQRSGTADLAVLLLR
jgi:hypothetical protein